jgi:hydrogenase large subunit
MVPRGITAVPSTGDLVQCRHLINRYRNWYEKQILGCSLERWAEVKSSEDLRSWVEENDAQRNSDLGFYLRFARGIGLDKIGKGHGNFISFGSFRVTHDSQASGNGGGNGLVPAGFSKGTRISPFDQNAIAEHVYYSWYEDHDGAKHPFEGETRPYACGKESRKYSWAKAPRYNEQPAETGPLAEMVIAKNPLFVDIVNKEGPSVFIRELARLTRPAMTIPVMEKWINELGAHDVFYESPGRITEGKACGLTQASRGALGHWVMISNSQIEHYQIITPTAWNASPRDSEGIRGPWEEALIGTQVRDLSNPVELGHVIRSFDACLVCTVHTIEGKKGKRHYIMDRVE